MYHLSPPKIRELLAKNNYTISEAERLSGLNNGALRNVINGSSKNPSLMTIIKVSQTLKCSIYELLESDESHTIHSDVEIINPQLLLDAQKFVFSKLSARNTKITFERLFSLANQIYSYSITNNLDVIDEKFANWLIENDHGGSS